MALCARDLSLTLSGVPVLDSVAIDLQPGRITTVLGPNGAGKTTLLRVLSGELQPDAGCVSLGDRLLDAWIPRQRARHLAVLPQQSLLNFPFTASEVVMLGRTPHDSGLAQDREIVAQALSAVDGAYLSERIYTQLSGGEKQRVHLARVLAQIWAVCPEGERYLLLDEPTSSFDLAHQQLTLDIVRNLALQGVGVLMVLHDINLAARCAHHMILMQCGRVAVAGTPLDVLQRDTIARVFQVEATIGVHPVSGTPLVIT